MSDSRKQSYHAVPAELQSAEESPSEVRQKSVLYSLRQRDSSVFLLMAFSFAGAIVFAIAHHCFYNYWNKRVVRTNYQQKWITRGGIAFAFGFKVLLVLSVGAAYTQCMWLSLRQKAFNTDQINNMFAVLTNAFSFTKLQLWIRVPLLATVALACWLIPVVTIITPGSILVASQLYDSTAWQNHIPALDFTYSISSFGSVNENGGGFYYVVPGTYLLQVALASSISASILPMHEIPQNTSWTLDFIGPAIDCKSDNQENTDFLSSRTWNATSTPEAADTLAYFSWVPNAEAFNGTFTDSYLPSLNNSDTLSGVEFDSELIAIYVLQPVFRSLSKSSLLKCVLQNVTYNVNFTFVNGQQTTAVQKQEVLNQVYPLESIGPNVAGLHDDPVQLANYQTYLSIFFGFAHVLAGSMWRSDEFGTIYKTISTVIPYTNVANLLGANDTSLLGPACEELFQNITMSLFSSTRFQYNATENPFLDRSAQVTTTVTQNIYEYKSLDLLVSYGVAVFCGSICLMVGWTAMHQNGATYNNDFTTIMRTTKRPELDACLTSAFDLNGFNPLPEHTKKVYLQYHQGNGKDQIGGFSLR